MRSMLLFFCFLAAVIFATIAIFNNRKKINSVRNQPKDPVFNSSQNYPDPLFIEDSNETELDEAGKELVDPVVEGTAAATPAKYITIKHYDRPLKNAAPTKNLNPITPGKNYDLINHHADPIETTYGNPELAQKFFRNDIITLFLMSSSDKPYSGYELLQALLAAGLRFGKKNIFHRYSQPAQAGSNEKILFSLASAMKPGTFEMPKMGGFSSPALVLFMEVSAQRDVQAAFDAMLDAARQLIEDLGGEIKDESRQFLTEEKISDMRNLIAEYEKSLRNADMFVG